MKPPSNNQMMELAMEAMKKEVHSEHIIKAGWGWLNQNMESILGIVTPGSCGAIQHISLFLRRDEGYIKHQVYF